MALMSKEKFEGFADRIAKQYSYVKECFDALSNSAVGEQYYAKITSTGDPDIELPMLQVAYNADQFFKNRTTVDEIRGFSAYLNLINGFENSVRTAGTIEEKTMDGYCEAVSASVSDYTNKVYYAAKNDYMLARHVWCEEEKIIGTCTYNGTVLSFAVGSSLYLDAYDINNKANGNNYMAVPLRVKNTGSAALNVVVELVGVGANGQVGITEQLTISNLAANGYSSITSEKFVRITAINLISGGSSGDSFVVVNCPLRQIAL